MAQAVCASTMVVHMQSRQQGRPLSARGRRHARDACTLTWQNFRALEGAVVAAGFCAIPLALLLSADFFPPAGVSVSAARCSRRTCPARPGAFEAERRGRDAFGLRLERMVSTAAAAAAGGRRKRQRMSKSRAMARTDLAQPLLYREGPPPGR